MLSCHHRNITPFKWTIRIVHIHNSNFHILFHDTYSTTHIPCPGSCFFKRKSPARWGPPGVGPPRHGPPEMSIPEEDKREKIMKLIPSHDTRDTTHHSLLTSHLAQHTTHNTQHSTLNTQHTTHHAPHSDWKRPRQKILSGGAVAEKKMPPFLFFVHVCPCRTGDECLRRT